jgi:hypothetical protein
MKKKITTLRPFLKQTISLVQNWCKSEEYPRTGGVVYTASDFVSNFLTCGNSSGQLSLFMRGFGSSVVLG